MLDVALDYYGAGLAPIALDRSHKDASFKWGKYKERAPTLAELRAMFDSGPKNIANVNGRASGNVFDLDCDNPTVFAEQAARLAELGIKTWIYSRPPNGSKHDGGGHILLRAPQAVKFKSLPGGLEVRGQGSFSVLPPSEHDHGGLYGFLTKPPTIFTLPRLDALPWLPLEAADPPRPNIPRSAMRLLAGDPEFVSCYDSRSEAEAAICAALANAGFTFDGALGLFLTWSGPGKFREKHQRKPTEGIRYLYLTWHKAQQFVRQNPSPHKLLAQRLRRWASSRPWPGRTGSSDKVVYLAHLEIVSRCAKQPHGASVRELAELAGVHKDTASKANHRLVKAKLLELVQVATPSYPNRYKLLDAADVTIQDNPSITPVRDCPKVCHDAFRWKGLNKSGAEVLTALAKADDGTATVRELAEATGRHRSTVGRKLRMMFTLGLVEPVGRSLWRIVPEFTAGMLDQAAQEIGTAGLGQRQRRQHLRDRDRRDLKCFHAETRAQNGEKRRS